VVAAIDDGSVLPFEAFGAAEDPAGEAGAAQFGEAEATAAADVGTPDVGTPDVGTPDVGTPDADVDQPADDDAVGPGTLLALTQYAIAEESVAEGLQRLAATAEPVTGTPAAADGADAELDDRQRAAVEAVAEHGVSVLTGGPGTGKSRTVAAVVALAAESGLRVALAAPTGRAAKRLEELAGAPATTLHRLLGAQGRGLARSGSAGPDGGAADGDGLFADAGAEGAAADAGGFPRGQVSPAAGTAAGSSPAARNGRWTRTWWSSTKARCSTWSWPPRWSRPARMAPGCCWWATRRSCPRSGRAGSWPTSSTPAPSRSPS